MKSKLLTIAALALACVFSGCTSAPMVVNPRIPIGSKTDGMKVSDQRAILQVWTAGESRPGTITIEKRFSSSVRPEQVFGDVYSRVVVLKTGHTVGAVVGSIVANKYPKAVVEIKDFRGYSSSGVWAGRHIVEIAVLVKANGGEVLFQSRGENVFSSGDVRNFEIPYERALEDFARQITEAPEDLSRVVSRSGRAFGNKSGADMPREITCSWCRQPLVITSMSGEPKVFSIQLLHGATELKNSKGAQRREFRCEGCNTITSVAVPNDDVSI